jgi:dipeptidyl aminopeptidase/acylaminoacyl peptidase
MTKKNLVMYMKHPYLWALLPLLFLSATGYAQKKPLDHDVYDGWRSITSERISNKGNWAAYILQPRLGDGTLMLHQPKEQPRPRKGSAPAFVATQQSFARGGAPAFTWDETHLLFLVKPHLDTLKAQRRRKVKEDQLPKDTLAILALGQAQPEKIPMVRSFALPAKAGGWVAWHHHPQEPPKPPKPADSLEASKPLPKVKKENKDNGAKLVVINLKVAVQDTFPYVTDYAFSETASYLAFISTGNDSLFLPGVYVYDLANRQLKPLFRGKGKYQKLTWDKAGSQLAFLADLDTTKSKVRPMQLAYWKTSLDSASLVLGPAHPSFPEGWVLSEHGGLLFAENGSRLFFGTSPLPVLQDTLLLPEEIVQVEVWAHQDPYLYTQQQAEKEQELKRTYRAVWHMENGQVFQLGQEAIPDLQLPDEGNGLYALGLSNQPYGQALTWEGFPPYYDLYRVNIATGDTELLAEKIRGNPSLSPGGTYAYWYQPQDTAWLALAMETKTIRKLSAQVPAQLWDELHDYPDYPSNYGILGWTANDADFLVYDRYDVWQVPLGTNQPGTRLTRGREAGAVHRYIRLDPEERFINPGQPLLFHVHYEKTRAEAYAASTLDTGTLPTKVLEGDFMLNRRPLKAREANRILFTKETFQVFPDLHYADLSFQQTLVLSQANPWQKDYLWGSAEIVSWTSLDGQPLEGMLFKPENFDPRKKYPMIVNFYERSSESVHRHRAPEPHRSTINYTFYTSRGYLVFNPDVPYKPGYPGESCYNAVMPGIMSLIDKGFVDQDNIAAQGHSWGGYQVAYLATRTNLFKCIESGAPVVNMVSAYGGIRWETGLSRMFQYEHSQSRIGGTLWEQPLRYLENSPIFTMDKINTPMLIMHNDADGHVPWYQGIEFFVALRRLGKPVWMLNYNGEPHWPLKYQNQKDFVLRMQQFFDHYLKGAPQPVWMEKGVPAKYKGIIQGYETVGVE